MCVCVCVCVCVCRKIDNVDGVKVYSSEKHEVFSWCESLESIYLTH